MPKVEPSDVLRKNFSAESGGVALPVSIHSRPLLPNESKGRVALIIYGGGVNFTQQELNKLKLALLERGFAAAAGFNFRGHVDGGPDFYETGLHARVDDARSVAKRIKEEYPDSPLTVIAVSMGGYVSTFLDPKIVSNLVLVAPAAYHKDAVAKKLNFNRKEEKPAPFRELLRTEGSWKESDGFQNIRAFTETPLLVIRFEQDTVVYPEICEAYFAGHPGPKKMNVLPYPHNGNFINPEKVRAIANVTAAWLMTTKD